MIVIDKTPQFRLVVVDRVTGQSTVLGLAPARGYQGEKGDKGDPGNDGDPGPPGADGDPGPAGVASPWDIATVYPSGRVTAHAGALYSSRDSGNVGNVPEETIGVWWDVLQGVPIDNSVTNAKIPPNAAIDVSKLAQSATNDDLLATRAGVPAWVSAATLGLILAGDARLTDARTPLDSSVTDAKVASGAAISLSKLASMPALAARQVIAGTGLTGGGDLTADRTLSLAGAGAGAGTYGSTSAPISSIILDAYGRPTTITSTTIAGDVSGSLGALSVDRIKGSTLPTAPASGDAGRILVVSGANAWRYGRYREYETTFSLVGNSGATNGPTSIVTLPTRFKLAEAFASLTTAIAGAGGMSMFRLGSTSGGNEILTDWAIVVGTTTVGNLWGDRPGGATASTPERGTDMAAARGFGAYYTASQQIYARSVASGANITAGVVTILLCGWEIP